MHTTRTRTRTTAALIGAAALLGSAAIATAPSASAAEARDGTCESGEFCLYYNSDHQGSVSDFDTSIPDYGASQPSCYEYRGAGNGKGKCVKNDAASAWNRTGEPVTLYVNSNYGGATQTFAPGAKVNLNATLKNDNASHRIGGGGGDSEPPGGDYGTPRVNPHPEDSVVAPQMTARTEFVQTEVNRLTPEEDCFGSDYRDYQSPTSNHNTGNALDCTISDAIGEMPSETQRQQGWDLSNWLREHADRLDVRYVIFDNKIWSVARSDEGWRDYGGDGPTDGHYDHVHVSIQNPHGDG